MLNWVRIQEWLATSRPTRDVVDAGFRAVARRRVRELDHQSEVRCQAITLTGLVHEGRKTPFGRAHDFGRIRDLADYRRLVPIASYRHASSDRDVAVRPGIGIRSATLTALSLASVFRPNLRLFTGRVVGLPEELLPGVLRPYRIAPSRDGWHDVLKQRLTCVTGNVESLSAFASEVRQRTGRAQLREVWPDLAVALCVDNTPALDCSRIRAMLGPETGEEASLLLRLCLLPAGPVAVEDPRHGMLRLLPDAGVFFEFVPQGELGRGEPQRLSLAEVETQKTYSLVMTSPGGYWAWPSGLSVRFESLGPALMRLVLPVEATPTPVERIRVRLTHPPVQAPHPRTRDIPAARPGKLARTPLSVRGDRG